MQQLHVVVEMRAVDAYVGGVLATPHHVAAAALRPESLGRRDVVPHQDASQRSRAQRDRVECDCGGATSGHGARRAQVLVLRARTRVGTRRRDELARTRQKVHDHRRPGRLHPEPHRALGHVLHASCVAQFARPRAH